MKCFYRYCSCVIITKFFLLETIDYTLVPKNCDPAIVGQRGRISSNLSRQTAHVTSLNGCNVAGRIWSMAV